MPDIGKVIKGLECCQISMDDKNPFEKCDECPYNHISVSVQDCRSILSVDCIELLKEKETKPLRCKECSYHRNDGWCNEHGREVKESDYCSFGAWEGR